jgi:hypothetical protein
MQKVRRIPSKENDTNAAFQWRAALECACVTPLAVIELKLLYFHRVYACAIGGRCRLLVFNAQLTYALFVAGSLFFTRSDSHS